MKNTHTHSRGVGSREGAMFPQLVVIMCYTTECWRWLFFYREMQREAEERLTQLARSYVWYGKNETNKAKETERERESDTEYTEQDGAEGGDTEAKRSSCLTKATSSFLPCCTHSCSAAHFHRLHTWSGSRPGLITTSPSSCCCNFNPSAAARCASWRSLLHIYRVIKGWDGLCLELFLKDGN